MAKSSGEIAVELRAKFEAWLLAATFGLLALSIPSAKFGQNLIADLFELGAWLVLLRAGVIGIQRGESVPMAYDVQHKITGLVERRRRAEADIFQRGQVHETTFTDSNGSTVLKGDAAIAKFNELIGTLEGQYRDLEAGIIRRYSQLRTGFFVGVACLVVGRATPRVTELAELVRKSFF